MLLRNSLPVYEPDALIMQVLASGRRDGRDVEEAFARRIEPVPACGCAGALALVSAAHAATLIDLVRNRNLNGAALRAPPLVPHDLVFRSRYFARVF